MSATGCWRRLGNPSRLPKRLPPERLAAHRAIDWRGFAALRDVVAHQYFGLELPRLWPTITDEVPLLIEAVAAELARLPDDCLPDDCLPDDCLPDDCLPDD